MHLVERANSTFTTQELERLAAYRSAVAAGFYTDWDGSADTLDTEVLAWFDCPFTAEERQRLERCRAALAAGAYRDDQPPEPGEAGATPDEPVR